MPSDSTAVIEMRNISLSFPGVRALDNVDLTLRPGEVHAVMGENGAGKSTLIKVLTGAYRMNTGSITMAGVGSISTAAEAQAAGIAAAYQENFLCRNLSIGENVMLGHEIRGRFGIDWPATHREAERTLADLGLADLDTRAKLLTLSASEQQLVAIGRSMVTKPRVLILDEPTSSLDHIEAARLFEVIRRLREQQVAILFVSHFLEQVYSISDRITILRDGRSVGVYETRELDRAELIAKMLGKDLAALKQIGSQRRAHRREPVGAAVYRAENVGSRGVLDPLDIELHKGEIVGLAGLRGSGRTELAEMLGGIRRHDSGEVWVGGQRARLSSPAAGLRSRVAVSTENRRDDGLVGDLSVQQNIMLAIQALRGWARPISKSERDSVVRRYIEGFDIHPATPDTLVKNLSGGNQQKVLLARWLATHPRVLILDEPTRGVDIGAKVEIQAQIAQLAVDGVAVLFVSSELSEVVRLSDRIVVMKDRHKLGELSNGPALTVDSIVELIAADPSEDDDELTS